ncbi:hypothetical protein [Streptomyces sp. I5]|uniref:hypothetical protein n=1 Tax=Streptomyces sp. I5 TaxID=2759947 RepID=UPI0018EE86D1|nr:hypothetical protein [Streptomyces sp. I5]MBJ6636704.1 hypothetical protein [Streptomyces sp. I5]
MDGMVKGGRQRRDGPATRVQFTSGDHGEPKDKKAKGTGKSTPLRGTAASGFVSE